MFRDRSEAGQRLAARLQHYREAQPVVLALPRGGVPVGFEIARVLNAPLDLLFVRKIGVPWQPELAAAAVAEVGGSEIVRNEHVIRHGPALCARYSARLVEIDGACRCAGLGQDRKYD